jgi:hypothetical protein
LTPIPCPREGCKGVLEFTGEMAGDKLILKCSKCGETRED